MLPQAVGSPHSIERSRKMWVDTKDSVPIIDGTYLVQTVDGNITPLMYTVKGGWNTHYDDVSGDLSDKNALPMMYVARWFEVPTPQDVPTEWKKEYLKGVIENAVQS